MQQLSIAIFNNILYVKTNERQTGVLVAVYITAKMTIMAFGYIEQIESISYESTAGQGGIYIQTNSHYVRAREASQIVCFQPN